MASTINKFSHLQIPLEDVLEATNNFHDDNIIGRGGFGLVYKGRLLRSGKLIKIVALRLDRKHGQRDIEFWTEISVLSDLKHTNLVSIVGFCDEKNEKIIITTHQPKGSLKEHLNSPNLTCTQRLKICVGVARALSYLRYDEGRGYGVIHLNINSSTILLDENWDAKLSGFKVSIKQSANRMDQVVLSEPIGTIGYADPTIEKTGGVTHKSDIYSFGVVLLEILCGREAYVKNEANRLLTPLAKYHYENKTLKDIIHPDMWNHMSPKSLIIYSKVAYSCIKEDHALRPDTNHIVAELEKALELQLQRENLGKNFQHLKLCLSDIELATDNFSKNYVIGYSEWYIVYRVELDHSDEESHSFEDGKNKGEPVKRRNIVAIKRVLPRDDLPLEEAFYTTIEILTSVKHRNIVTLLGFCIEGSESIFVTEDICNGYLGFHYLRNANNTRVLNWEKRLKICIDVAHALNYLHSEMEDQKMIVNCGIQSNAIGLDKNFGAKIVEFGTSLYLPPNQNDEALYLNKLSGPKYYRDPEYEKTGKIKRESDVYSFGVVLFEILCGRLANDPNYLQESDKGLAPLARQWFSTGTLEDMIDPIIKEEFDEKNFLPNRGPNKDSLHTIIEIANQCVIETQDQRPTMKAVIEELEKAIIFQENNKDNLRMSLEEVKLATQNFHHDNCIGGGGFAGRIYTGKVPQGDGFNAIVAKRFDTRLDQAEQQFFN